MVTFAALNFIEEVYPSPVNNTNAMDIIFCRNVLMYFTPAQAQGVVHRLYQALLDGGWLFVGPSELSLTLFARFTAVSCPGMLLYKKGNARPQPEVDVPLLSSGAGVPGPQSILQQPAGESPPFDVEARLEPPTPPTPYAVALELYDNGRYAEVIEKLAALSPTQMTTSAMALLARAYANQGKLAPARDWVERAIAADKLEGGLHYLLATVLQEQGDIDAAIKALKRVIYLEQNFVLAHVALGHLTLRRQQHKEARKHFENALTLLRAYQPDEVLPESEGITASRLRDLIRSLLDRETAA
jgi:chemotaxis protein methyltransferase CheR